MTCNLPRIRSPLWTRRTAEVGWANCKRGDRELDGLVTSKLIMFPGVGTWDVTEGAVRNGPAASGIFGYLRNSRRSDRGIALVEKRRTWAKVCAENSSYAPLGLGHFPFHPRLTPWAIFSRRSAAKIAGSGLPPLRNSTCHAHARVLTHTLEFSRTRSSSHAHARVLTHTLETWLILHGLRGAEAPLFHGG